MKFKKYLQEKYIFRIRSLYGSGNSLEVFKNPTKNELRDIIATDALLKTQFRFAADAKDKSFYAFGIDALHQDVIKKLTGNSKDYSDLLTGVAQFYKGKLYKTLDPVWSMYTEENKKKIASYDWSWLERIFTNWNIDETIGWLRKKYKINEADIIDFTERLKKKREKAKRKEKKFWSDKEKQILIENRIKTAIEKIKKQSKTNGFIFKHKIFNKEYKQGKSNIEVLFDNASSVPKTEKEIIATKIVKDNGKRLLKYIESDYRKILNLADIAEEAPQRFAAQKLILAEKTNYQRFITYFKSLIGSKNEI